MIGNQKEKNESASSTRSTSKLITRSVYSPVTGKPKLNSKIIAPVLSGVLQVLIGFTLVGISILGLLTPIWLSAVMSLAGSISAMAGVYLIFHTINTHGTFDSLINKAIHRVIKEQN